MKFTIITNNAMISQKYNTNSCIKFIEGDFLDVLSSVRDKIHEGYKLLTHPLSGSVKPNETPYKSIIISNEKNNLDIRSVTIIEESIVTAKKFINIGTCKKWDNNTLEDFMEIDLALLQGGIESITQFSKIS